MDLIPFASWTDVMSHARSNAHLYYHAPLDARARQVVVVVNKRTLRVAVPGAAADPFTANKDHLDRFRREAPVYPFAGLTIHASRECAVAIGQRAGCRVWAIPDNPGKVAITQGGTKDEAHKAVVDALHEKYAGDWSFQATLLDVNTLNEEPCAWCLRHERYAH